MSAPPPIELLPALVALLETESVTKAAERLHVGQPAMSRTLEKLRSALSDELLVRNGRQLVRTRRGEALLPEARALLSRAETLLAPQTHFDPGTAQGVVTLALGDDLQLLLTHALLTALRDAAPALDIRIRPLAMDSPLALSRGDIDLLLLPDLRTEVQVPGMGDLVLSPQYVRRFVTISRKRRKLTLTDFLEAEHVLVSPQGKPGSYVDDALHHLDKKRRVAVTVPTFQAALTLVSQSELIATFPEDIALALSPQLYRQACPVLTPELTMCIAWSMRTTQDSRNQWLRALVSSVFKRYDPLPPNRG